MVLDCIRTEHFVHHIHKQGGAKIVRTPHNIIEITIRPTAISKSQELQCFFDKGKMCHNIP